MLTFLASHWSMMVPGSSSSVPEHYDHGFDPVILLLPALAIIVGLALALYDKHHEAPAPRPGPDPVIERNGQDQEEWEARVLPQVEARIAEINIETARRIAELRAEAEAARAEREARVTEARERAHAPAPQVELSDEAKAARLDAAKEKTVQRAVSARPGIALTGTQQLIRRIQEQQGLPAPKRDLPDDEMVGNLWGNYVGAIVSTFSAPGQVIDHEPTGTAFFDTCLVCGGDTRPFMTVTEPTVTRGYYKCGLQHPSGELPAWWTDWKSSEVLDRQVIFTPDLVGGGNTWSTVPLGKKWGDELSDLFSELRPEGGTR